MPFGLNKYLIIGIAAAIVIALGTVAIYQWRADIKQLAYDHIFKEMAENELKEKDKEIKRLKDLETGREEAVKKSVRAQQEAQIKLEALQAVIRGQSLSKEPLSLGYGKALDAIQDFGRIPDTK
jgi:uncharacterized protein HemX